MKNFKSFIRESTEAKEKQLKHLEHLEDHPFNAGQEGTAHAIQNLTDVHKKLRGKNSDTKITTKYDGAPSVVFGHHPENGKFFVSTKSVFNKAPKLNYTDADIEKNHGHDAGLVKKLKIALKHLPKVVPPRGVYQGDLMHTRSDVEEGPRKVSFKPNTITYSTNKGSNHGKSALNSKMGIAIHTAYRGDTLPEMEAQYAPNLEQFGNHPDVHLISTEHNLDGAKYDKDQQTEFKTHLKAAMKAARELGPEGYEVISGHKTPLKTYINHTVRTKTNPTVNGFMKHYEDAHQKKIDALKTLKGKEAKTVEMQRALQDIVDNKEKLQNSLNLHNHLQKAKDVLTHAMSTTSDFDHHINGKKSKPEGFVVVRNNRPTKFVDRKEFSAANFNKDAN